MLNKLKQKLEEADKKKQQLIDRIKVSEETQRARFSICESCEHLFKPTNTCKKCGCFMDAKTWLAGASCPIGKWKSIDPEDKIAVSQDS